MPAEAGNTVINAMSVQHATRHVLSVVWQLAGSMHLIQTGLNRPAQDATPSICTDACHNRSHGVGVSNSSDINSNHEQQESGYQGIFWNVILLLPIPGTVE